MKITAADVMLLVTAVALVVFSNVVTKSRALVHGAAKDAGVLPFVFSMLSDVWMWSALLATGTGMFLYVLALRHVDLSVAQPIIAMVFVLTPLTAFWFLGESMAPLRLTGLAIIALGIAIVARSA